MFVVNVDVPLYCVDDLVSQVERSTGRCGVGVDDVAEERSNEVGVMEVGNEWGVCRFGAVVVIVEVDGVGGYALSSEIYVATVGMRIMLNVELGIEIVDPEGGLAVD